MKAKGIPENLKACIEPQPIPKKWWTVGTIVEVVSSIIMLLMLLTSLGVIILLGVHLNNLGILNLATGFAYVLGSLFACAFFAFLFFCSYKLLALVFYTKSTIVYNSDVLANIAIKNRSEVEE